MSDQSRNILLASGLVQMLMLKQGCFMAKLAGAADNDEADKLFIESAAAHAKIVSTLLLEVPVQRSIEAMFQMAQFAVRWAPERGEEIKEVLTNCIKQLREVGIMSIDLSEVIPREDMAHLRDIADDRQALELYLRTRPAVMAKIVESGCEPEHAVDMIVRVLRDTKGFLVETKDEETQ